MVQGVHWGELIREVERGQRSGASLEATEVLVPGRARALVGVHHVKLVLDIALHLPLELLPDIEPVPDMRLNRQLINSAPFPNNGVPILVFLVPLLVVLFVETISRAMGMISKA